MEIESGLEQKVAFFENGRKNIGHQLGIEIIKIYKDELIAKMPVDERTHQPFGLLHGGASVVLAETLASVGAWMNLDDDSKMAVGLEINANHIKAVRSGYVIGTGKPIHKGRQTQVWEVKIHTESGKLVCISRCTLSIVNRR